LLLGARRALDEIIARIDRPEVPGTGRLLSVIVLLALFVASITQAIGLHRVFGGFIVGVTVGDSRRLTERTRVVIEDFVMSVFAPVFFAAIALRVDFVGAFDLRLCFFVLVVAAVAKAGGAMLGARLSSIKWREAWAVGVGLNARGAMAIIVAV